MSKYQIRMDDLSSEAVRALLELHMQGMPGSSPADSVSALDLSGLQTSDVSMGAIHGGNWIVSVIPKEMQRYAKSHPISH